MPKLKDNQVPSYRLHKQSGQAIVTHCGRDFLLGEHGSPESQAEYNRLTSEWMANGRRLPDSQRDVSVSELAAAFWLHAERYYRSPDDTPAGELGNFKLAIGPCARSTGDVGQSLRPPVPQDDSRPHDQAQDRAREAGGKGPADRRGSHGSRRSPP